MLGKYGKREKLILFHGIFSCFHNVFKNCLHSNDFLPDDNLYVVQIESTSNRHNNVGPIIISLCERERNIVGKAESVSYRYFLLCHHPPFFPPPNV